MERIKPHTLSGFMELLPGEQAMMDKIMDTIRRVYGLYGFTALDTTAFSNAVALGLTRGEKAGLIREL